MVGTITPPLRCRVSTRGAGSVEALVPSRQAAHGGDPLIVTTGRGPTTPRQVRGHGCVLSESPGTDFVPGPRWRRALLAATRREVCRMRVLGKTNVILGGQEAKIMTSALPLIATFHAVLWVSLAVLTVLESPHPERRPELLATSPAVMPDEPAAEHDSEHDGESLRPAA